ncbi:4'-phosphopantetheinyl transferase family protein [Bacillus sp. RC252]|uniref:4'-phosphopantetheinyl transferase family protein n=1 Tax=Bacillus sp. RC252 TaxID=3156289 RepID=UPI0038379B71
MNIENNCDLWSVAITDKQEKGASAYLSVFQTAELSSFSPEIHCLHPLERSYFDSLKSKRRIQSYLSGRMAAKLAVSMSIHENRLETICIDRGLFQQPVIVHPSKGNYQVSITHNVKLAAAIAHTEHVPMGIDLESIDERLLSFFKPYVTDLELTLCRSLIFHDSLLFTILWTTKEALSKVLRTGLTVPIQLFELNHMEERQGYIISRFTNFPQYEAVSFLFQNEVCSIVYPKQLELNNEVIQQLFVKAGCNT